MSLIEKYLTVEKEEIFEVKIQRSLFIGIIKPLEANPSDILKEVKENYKNATHYCYAYRKVTGEEYFSDGGEPTGTAGIPILNALREKDLYNIIGVVVRYFGGIKLGVRGLIDAYHFTMEKTIEKAKIVEKMVTVSYRIKATYKDFPNIKRELIKNFSCEIGENFGEDVVLEVKVPITLKEEFIKYISKRRVEIEKYRE